MTVTDWERTRLAEDFNYALGQRLRAARRHRGWSLGDVESHTQGEFKASVVGAYERGERAISVQRFVSLADVYRTPPSDLLPAPSEPTLVIDLDALTEEDGDLVDRYMAAIQMMRKQPGVGEVRDSDRAVISSLLQSVKSPDPS
ncbi:MAG TPA: helix-turn-helix transcriptional regulator [Acidimicrobiia bacterium]|nr:helix-turn-helix transcriptional regulator [Acidimicrobiia bacterium]